MRSSLEVWPEVWKRWMREEREEGAVRERDRERPAGNA